jgi:hypothetical protein
MQDGALTKIGWVLVRKPVVNKSHRRGIFVEFMQKKIRDPAERYKADAALTELIFVAFETTNMPRLRR